MTLYFLISIVVFIILCYCIRRFPEVVYKSTNTTLEESIDRFLVTIMLVFYSVAWAITIPMTVLIILIILLGNFIFEQPK